MTPEEMIARVLHRDGLMLIIDKPAGIPVHRGPVSARQGEARALEDYFDALRYGLPRAPSLAHRLDRDTSGCLILGRHRKALDKLAALFKQGRIAKTYWAMVEGGPAENSGLIDLPLARRDETRGWWMKADPAGQPSQTRWTVMGRGEGMAWLALEPLTGRTHQLRVHCAEMGWPILGDPIYGPDGQAAAQPLHLHARAVAVPLGPAKRMIHVEAPVPEHMRAALSACGWTGEAHAAVASGAA